MTLTVALIAPGAMGSSVGRYLRNHGLDVCTTLAGRSVATRERAVAAGLREVQTEQLGEADILLSIVPPSEALPLAQELAPVLARTRKTLYVDCNAIAPATVEQVGQVIMDAGCPFADAAIFGAPPSADRGCPSFYVSGEHAGRFAQLSEYGLPIKVLNKPIGAASGLKMSYAGITKGLTGLITAMILSAERNGAGQALHDELACSQPALLEWAHEKIPEMYPKAYRWVAEMEEIAAFSQKDRPSEAIYLAMAQLYWRLAENRTAGSGNDIAALERWLSR
ncbi:6-phosphogluconate dehydrogenase-like protein [Pseudomonas duriflava]|uniref:6-phosphogluconate dehydrogenase-like protein n=1 Tax=Pseudomonas duriflava TaxID=459528 RepID=A0A562QP77_9PSED|nr:NAD(P)-dependent oxidoreductase [Pseudomonas duriflava]TWI58559.1 6-phosphogluconate dehydrogenase-like protein [Pseudomonas duriflava]